MKTGKRVIWIYFRKIDRKCYKWYRYDIDDCYFSYGYIWVACAEVDFEISFFRGQNSVFRSVFWTYQCLYMKGIQKILKVYDLLIMTFKNLVFAKCEPTFFFSPFHVAVMCLNGFFHVSCQTPKLDLIVAANRPKSWSFLIQSSKARWEHIVYDKGINVNKNL